MWRARSPAARRVADDQVDGLAAVEILRHGGRGDDGKRDQRGDQSALRDELSRSAHGAQNSISLAAPTGRRYDVLVAAARLDKSGGRSIEPLPEQARRAGMPRDDRTGASVK
jgi:hypothetical protein